MAGFGDVLRGLGSVLNPQVAQELAAEDKQKMGLESQLGMFALQRQAQLQDQARQQAMLEKSPEYLMKMEALKNEKGFREAVAGAGGDMTQIASAAIQFGKPELAVNIFNAKEQRIARMEQAKIENERHLKETEMRMQDRALDRESRERLAQQAMELKKVLGGMTAQIAREGNELRRLTLATKPEQMSPEARATFNAGLKDVQRDDKDVANATSIENALKRWNELQKEVVTGRVTGLRPAVMQPQLQEMRQLENWLAANNFKPGQGQISNFERQLIKGSGPLTTNDAETNDRIVKVMLGGVQNAKERAEFREWYLDKNKKTLGSDKAWNEFVEKNPRYKSDKKGGLVENEERKSWQEYFKVGGASEWKVEEVK